MCSEDKQGNTDDNQAYLEIDGIDLPELLTGEIEFSESAESKNALKALHETGWEMNIDLKFSAPLTGYNVLVIMGKGEVKVVAEDSMAELMLQQIEIGTKINFAGHPFTVIGNVIDERGFSLLLEKGVQDE